jgi:hypothetical protein
MKPRGHAARMQPGGTCSLVGMSQAGQQLETECTPLCSGGDGRLSRAPADLILWHIDMSCAGRAATALVASLDGLGQQGLVLSHARDARMCRQRKLRRLQGAVEAERGYR